MTESTATLTASENRRALITQLEGLRGSRVVCYVLSDRQGATAQIADDAVRPLYDHLRAIGHCEKLDLFLYSVGGLTDVPWRIVSMIRESAETFDVIVPYRAMSAATMIALGADHILMGPKGELGPIDPQFSVSRGREGETPVQDQIAVEDIMSYLRLLRERVGLSDQAARGPNCRSREQGRSRVSRPSISGAFSHQERGSQAHGLAHQPDGRADGGPDRRDAG
jgi:Serine dehydrogenase proteinase